MTGWIAARVLEVTTYVIFDLKVLKINWMCLLSKHFKINAQKLPTKSRPYNAATAGPLKKKKVVAVLLFNRCLTLP